LPEISTNSSHSHPWSLTSSTPYSSSLAFSALQMSHTSGAWGCNAMLVGYPETGQGAVVMTNLVSADGIIRSEIMGSIVVEYGWPMVQDS